MITGNPPFVGDTPIATATKHITEKPEKLSKHRNDIPKGIENAVIKLLHKYPKDRFKNAEDLRAVLLQQKTQLQAMQTQENLVVRARSRNRVSNNFNSSFFKKKKSIGTRS